MHLHHTPRVTLRLPCASHLQRDVQFEIALIPVDLALRCHPQRLLRIRVGRLELREMSVCLRIHAPHRPFVGRGEDRARWKKITQHLIRVHDRFERQAEIVPTCAVVEIRNGDLVTPLLRDACSLRSQQH